MSTAEASRPSYRPLVVAHRGASGDVAEHTLAAYELAVREGADALECDVRLTRDGVLVCVHDRKIDRVSSGRGVVSTLELQELSELDFASWKNRRRDPLLEAAWDEADLDLERSSVLTLDRLLQLAVDSTTPDGAPVQVHVETKHPTRYGGLVERALLATLERYRLATPVSATVSRVTVMSYAPTSLRRVRAMAPTLPLVLLMDRVPVRYRDGGFPPHVRTVGVALNAIKSSPRFVDRAHARGCRVHCFTADDPRDIEYLFALGVDAVISNHPSRVLRLLRERSQS